MTCTTDLVATRTSTGWTRAHTEVVDERCWGPPPGAVARVVRRLVDLVADAHGRGLALPGLGPDAVLVDAADEVSIAVVGRPGTAAERAVDLLGMGAALCALATGTDPEVVADPVGLPAQRARVARLLDAHAAGNPCAADLAPVVLALLDPDPTRRPDAAALRMLLTGRPPRTGTAQLRLAG